MIFTDSITQLIQEHGEQFVTTSIRFKVETFVFWFLYPQWVFWSRYLMIITLPLLPLLYSIWIFILYIFKYVYTHTHVYTDISTTFICLYICVCLYIYTHTYIYIYLYLSFPNIFTISYSKIYAGNIYAWIYIMCVYIYTHIYIFWIPTMCTVFFSILFHSITLVKMLAKWICNGS